MRAPPNRPGGRHARASSGRATLLLSGGSGGATAAALPPPPKPKGHLGAAAAVRLACAISSAAARERAWSGVHLPY
eukprot:2180268-Prymnesium_polylepis.1